MLGYNKFSEGPFITDHYNGLLEASMQGFRTGQGICASLSIADACESRQERCERKGRPDAPGKAGQLREARQGR
jgi:hypothetical protein